MKDICIITSSRADFGIISGLVSKLSISKFFKLKLIVTGMHLSEEYGLTINEIEQKGFYIYKRVKMSLDNDSTSSTAKAIGVGIMGFADIFDSFKPDFVVIVGDRYEMLAAGISAMIANLPIVHIGGGEVTQGSFDEAIRHSLTKMSHFHFVSTESYRKRVIQLGEIENTVFNVGSLSIENLKEIKLLNKKQLEEEIDFSFGNKNITVTLHPETNKVGFEKQNFQQLINALYELSDINIIFTEPNADPKRNIISKMIKDFVANNKDRSISFKSMGYVNYLSALQFVDGVVGNSSSGITEAPSFKIGTVNIGNRQTGREKAPSIIDCGFNKKNIKESINLLFDDNFIKKLKKVKNPYEGKNPSEVIMDVLKKNNGIELLKKEFYDL